MAANPFSGDDTDSAEKWDACWNALESLPGCDLPTVAMHAEAVRIISSYRAVTEGRGIERIEDRAQAAYRLGVGRLAAGSDEHLNRFMVALGGALGVLRRVPRESPGNPRSTSPLPASERPFTACRRYRSSLGESTFKAWVPQAGQFGNDRKPPS